jgi:hypothetical protein
VRGSDRKIVRMSIPLSGGKPRLAKPSASCASPVQVGRFKVFAQRRLEREKGKVEPTVAIIVLCLTGIPLKETKLERSVPGFAQYAVANDVKSCQVQARGK